MENYFLMWNHQSFLIAKAPHTHTKLLQSKSIISELQFSETNGFNRHLRDISASAAALCSITLPCNRSNDSQRSLIKEGINYPCSWDLPLKVSIHTQAVSLQSCPSGTSPKDRKGARYQTCFSSEGTYMQFHLHIKYNTEAACHQHTNSFCQQTC